MSAVRRMLEWDDSWTTSVRQFDDDHKHLIDIHNQLFDACFHGQGPMVIVPIVEELIHYTDDHFGREEELFERYDFPGSAEHIREHEDLKMHLIEIRDGLKSGRTQTISNETLAFLEEWIEVHTKNMDTQYGAFMNERGIT